MSFNRFRRDRSRSSAHRRRPLAMERLEDRMLLASTLYLDFGFGFTNGTLTVTDSDMATQGVNGPQKFGAGHTLSSLTATLQKFNLDTNGDGAVNQADAQILADDIVEVVERIYEPFDVNVRVVRASTINGVKTTLASTGTNDAYVFVAGNSPPPPNDAWGWAPVDHGNTQDNTAFAFADDIFGVLSGDQANPLANVAAHEAGHTYGLSHTNGSVLVGGADLMGAPMPGQPDLRQREIINILTRYDLDAEKGGTQNAHDLLKTAVGLRPNAPAYVTGTGAHDTIQLTRLNATQASVTINSFDSPDYLGKIGIPFFSYTIDVTNGVLVDASCGADQIYVDADLGTQVTIRGGEGIDELVLRGKGAASGTFTLNAATWNSARWQSDVDATVTVGSTTIELEEFESTGRVFVQDISSFTVVTSNIRSNLEIAAQVSPTYGPLSTTISGGLGDLQMIMVELHNVPNITLDASTLGSGSTGWQDHEIEVQSTEPGTSVKIRTGEGSDQIFVSTTASGSSLDVWLGDGNDTVELGRALTTHGPDALGSILGPVKIGGGPGSDVINVYDQKADGGQVYEIASVNRDLPRRLALLSRSAAASITWEQAHLVLNASDSGNTVNVVSTSRYEPVTVYAGAGNDTVNVGGTASTLDEIVSALTLHGQQGNDQLRLNDQGSSGSRSYGIYFDKITHGGFGDVGYDTFESMVLNATHDGSGPVVYSTPAGTSVTLNTGAGDDTIQVGGIHAFTDTSVTPIKGPLTINGQRGQDRLHVFDETHPPVAHDYTGAYTITDTTVTRTPYPGSRFPFSMSYSQVEELLIRAGGPSGATFDLQSTATGTPLTIFSDDGNDTFLVTGNTHRSNVTIHAGKGTDKMELMGSGGDDTAVLRVGSVELTCPAYKVCGDGLESIFVNGSRGTDVARLYDSPGADTFVAKPNQGEMTGPGYANRVENFAKLNAYATPGGKDVAMLYDSPGNDTFHATPEYGRLYGTGFDNRAESFDYVHGYATPGGADVAKLYDSSANDTFQAWPDMAKLFGKGYYNRAKSFPCVHAYATAGGTEDVAQLYDSAGIDTFEGKPEYGRLYGSGFDNWAESFDYVHGYSSAGGADLAKLYDSNGNDKFQAWPDMARLFGKGYYNRVKSFSCVHAYATAGGTGDVAQLYDSAGTDTFEGKPEYGRLYGSGFDNWAESFDYVHAYATPGGADVANFYDSPGKDTFQAWPTMARLIGSGYYNRAKSFRYVNAYASSGDDVAELYDSALADQLKATASWACLSNNDPVLGFSNRVQGFKLVKAWSSNNNDTKQIDPAALDWLVTVGWD